MGIAVKFKKTLLILCVATSISACVKKETPDFGKNEDANKPYTEDKNGEMIFYDLKKPAIEATINVVESDHRDLSDSLFNELKDKVGLLDKISLIDEPKLTQITIKLNKINEFGDGYIEQVKHEIPLVLKAISNKTKNKNVLVSFEQWFADGSSLKMSFKGDSPSTVNKENLFTKMNLSKKGVHGDAEKFITLICDSSKTDGVDYEFCIDEFSTDNQKKLQNSKSKVSNPNKDGIEQIIKDNAESAPLKKEHSLSEDQKKILEDAGFEITLNE